MSTAVEILAVGSGISLLVAAVTLAIAAVALRREGSRGHPWLDDDADDHPLPLRAPRAPANDNPDTEHAA